MQDLTQLHLRGDGLMLVDTEEQVARYNACLREMGFKETSLKRFRVDAMGWSPEIADEQGCIDYLAHSAANPYAIVLDPRQRHAPIFNPFHSFDWDLMKQVFDLHRTQIELATAYEGLCVEIDQRVDNYHKPEDFLLVDMIMVRIWTPSRIMRDAHEQKILSRRFLEEEGSHLDVGLISDLINTRDKIGDLRTKPMFIPDMEYLDVSCFYTRALGGWFVLRGTNGHKPLLISKDETIRSKGVNSSGDQQILRELENLGMISYEMERWMDNLYRLEIIRDSYLVDVLDELQPDLNFVQLSTPQQKKWRQDETVIEKLPKAYFQLDQLIQDLKHGRIPEKIPRGIKPFLAHPIVNLPNSVSEVVWYVLSMVCDGRSVVRFYRYDKEGFFSAFDTWKTPKQTWAIRCIEQYYEYRMMKR